MLELFLVPLVFISSVYAEIPVLKEFTPPPENYNKVNDLFEVTNLPTIPPQGGRGICFVVSVALILTAENCRFLKEDCKTYTSDKIFSPYGLVRRWYTNDSKYMNAYDMDGGSVVNSLNGVIYEGEGTPSLECTAKSKTMPGFIDSDDNAKKEVIMWGGNC
ncbi:TPA: hypothetical protein MB352_004688 [Klebsiella variicola subsp. variicola]|nr:hypothetical protein [Klebsiella variicola subsp. variicola]